MPQSLMLIPTDFERNFLPRKFTRHTELTNCVIETCGFGVVASGIRTSQLLAIHRPQKVLLLGIAGAYRGRLAVGTATSFSRIACYGIGAGCGQQFQTAGELGWSQWKDMNTAEAIHDVINLESNEASDSSGATLVTTCAASGCEADAENRLRKFPDADAEDMEAFSVAMACHMANVSLTVIRGISNIAGDRNKSHWKIAAAMQAAAELALSGYPS
jgi:futalosine hydrolase